MPTKRKAGESANDAGAGKNYKKAKKEVSENIEVIEIDDSEEADEPVVPHFDRKGKGREVPTV